MKRRLIILLSLLTMNFVSIPSSFTAGEGWVFDDKMTYDIYLYSYPPEQGSVIKDVRILRFEHIGNTTFLVIKSSGFRLKDSSGFVRLDAVAAILPNNESFLQDGQKIETRY